MSTARGTTTSAGKVDGSRTANVLLVEDNVGDARLIASLLGELETGELSVHVNVVPDGEAAINYLHRCGVYPDSECPNVVILDLNLPKKHGFEVLSEMRKRTELQKIPVFILTTSRAHEDIMKGYALGVASFITKPNNLSALEDVIKRFLAVELPRALREGRKHDSRFESEAHE